MIQHYVRIQLLPPPLQKRYYTHAHLQMLFIINHLKEVFALDEIKALFALAENYPTEQIYKHFTDLITNTELHTNNNFLNTMALMCKSVELKKAAAEKLKASLFKW